MLAFNAEVFKNVVVGVRLDFGIGRVCALSVIKAGINVLDSRNVACKDDGFGTYHNGSVAVGCDSYADSFEKGPEAAEVARVGIVGLGTVDYHNVKVLLFHHLNAFFASFNVFVVGNTNSGHGVFLL